MPLPVGQDAPKKGGHLVVGLTGGETTDSLDPTLINAQVVGDTPGQYCEPFILPARNGRDLEPRPAESWDHSADLKTWNFKLRKGVTFHNGKTMTAKDAVFSLNRHRGPDSKSSAAGSLSIVADVRIEGDNEFTVTLTEPSVEFPYIMTDHHIVVQPDGDPGNSGIGTGPYAITDAKHGVRYLTTRFKDDWQPNVGLVASIETLVINDAAYPCLRGMPGIWSSSVEFSGSAVSRWPHLSTHRTVSILARLGPQTPE